MIDSSRNMVRVVILFFVVCMCFFSCQRKGVVNEQVLYWQDREILFPQKNVFTLFGKDTVDMLFDSPYKILSYLDSMGCVSCKAQFPAWKADEGERHQGMSETALLITCSPDHLLF